MTSVLGAAAGLRVGRRASVRAGGVLVFISTWSGKVTTGRCRGLEVDRPSDDSRENRPGGKKLNPGGRGEGEGAVEEDGAGTPAGGGRRPERPRSRSRSSSARRTWGCSPWRASP